MLRAAARSGHEGDVLALLGELKGDGAADGSGSGDDVVVHEGSSPGTKRERCSLISSMHALETKSKSTAHF
ncbi:hypothetical protein GCM10023066_55490 [Nocardioides kongjuensis]